MFIHITNLISEDQIIAISKAMDQYLKMKNLNHLQTKYFDYVLTSLQKSRELNSLTTM